MFLYEWDFSRSLSISNEFLQVVEAALMGLSTVHRIDGLTVPVYAGASSKFGPYKYGYGVIRALFTVVYDRKYGYRYVKFTLLILFNLLLQ